MDVLAPVVKRIVVACSPEHAFKVFTEEIHTWWPLEGHSVSEDKVERVVFEPRVGGRILERWHDGSEHEWGEVSVWEPPRRVTFSWLPNPETDGPTQVEVTFEPNDDETVVTLEHRGWDVGYRDVEGRRSNYDSGWDGVLKLYAQKAESA